jgi:ketol-acid reductoisomerase
MTTRYAVQGFRQKGRALVADQPQSARSPEAAIAMAERLSATREGVIAYAQEIDVETDCYDEPTILFRSGSLPAELTD